MFDNTSEFQYTSTCQLYKPDAPQFYVNQHGNLIANIGHANMVVWITLSIILVIEVMVVRARVNKLAAM
jgi:hypothetical protein